MTEPVGPCPKWDDEKYEEILTWSGAEVEFTDTFTSPKDGTRVVPELAHWSVHTGHGFIGFTGFRDRVKDEKKARMAGALFVYLWHKGVPAELADTLCEMYAVRATMIAAMRIAPGAASV